jgi:tetratricopeptide (TPR) repeat protein
VSDTTRNSGEQHLQTLENRFDAPDRLDRSDEFDEPVWSEGEASLPQDGELFPDSSAEPTSILPSIDSDREPKSLLEGGQAELEAAEGDAELQARLHLAFALVCEQRLQDLHGALFHLQRAHQLQPKDPNILVALRDIYRRRQNWTMVLELLDEHLALEPDDEVRALLLFEKGQILEDWLANPELAKTIFREMLEQEGAGHLVLDRLRWHLRSEEDASLLVEVNRRAVAATSDRKRRALLYSEIGHIQRDRLVDHEGATRSLALAFSEDPANQEVRDALERLYENQQRWDELVEVLLTGSDELEDFQQRSAYYLRAGRICRDHLQQPERALELMQRALEVTATPQLVRELVELLELLGQSEGAVDVYVAALRGELAAVDRQLLLDQLGRALERRGREDDAIDAYSQALEAGNTSSGTRRSLERLYRKKGRHAELVALLARDAERVVSPTERARRLVELSELAEIKLRDERKAIELCRQALLTDEDCLPAMRTLERLYASTGQSAELLELLTSMAVHLTSTAQVDNSMRMGQLAEHLDQLDVAERHYAAVLQAEPDRLAAIHALQQLSARRGQSETLLTLIEKELSLECDEPRRRELVERAARVCELSLDDHTRARHYYEKLLELRPNDRMARRALARLCEHEAAWGELGELLEQEAARQDRKPAERAALYCEAAEIHDQLLGDVKRAEKVFEEAVELDASSERLLDGWARCLRKGGKWRALSETLGKLVSLANTPKRRADLLREQADVYLRQLDDEDAAIGCYRQSIETASNSAARSTLLALLEKRSRHAECIEVLETALQSPLPRGQRLPLLKKLGVRWLELGEHERAIDALQQGLQLAADDAELLDTLGWLYRSRGDYSKLVGTLRSLASCSDDRGDRARLLHEAGSLAESQLLEEHDPQAIFSAVLDATPGDEAALASLRRLCIERGDSDGLQSVCEARLGVDLTSAERWATLFSLAMAREASGDLAGAEGALLRASEVCSDWVVLRELRRIQEQLGQFRRAAETAERQAEVGQDDALAADVLLEVSHVLLDRFSDADGAVRVLRKILQRMPFHEQASREIEEVLVRQERWSELVEIARQRLQAAANGELRSESGSVLQAQIELLMRVAWIQREHLTQPADAVATLKQAIQLDPHHVSTLFTLAELHVSLGQWPEAVETFSRIVALSDDPDLLLRAHFQLGEIWRDKLDETRQAISSYQNVLAIRPKDARALRNLYVLFRAESDWDNAADIASRLVEVEKEPRQQVEHYVALAEIAEQGFGDLELAAERYAHAATIDPGDEKVLDQLCVVLDGLGRWERLVDAVRSYLASLPEEQQTRGIGRRMQLGEVLSRHLQRPAEALEQYRAVIEIDPTDIDARIAIANLLAEQGRLDEAVTEHLEVLALDPLNRESLRQLRHIWSRRRASEQAYAAASVLVCSGQAGDTDQRLYREYRASGVRTPQGTIDPSTYNSMVTHPAELHAGRAILHVLSESAHRIRPSDLQSWQVGRGDRLGPRSEDPIRGIVTQVRGHLGLVRDVDIYISHARPREVDLLMLDPPALVVGSAVVSSYSSREVRFWVAELLTYIRNKTWVAYGLDGIDLATLVLASERLVDPQAMATGVNENEVVELSRIMQRSLGRRARRALEDAVVAQHDARRPSFSEWALAMRLSALRTALWMVNDLETAFEHLRRHDPQLLNATNSQQLSVAMRRSRVAGELIRYWISEEILMAKKAVGSA